MMELMLYILAAGDSDPTITILVGAVAVAIWVIGALASAAKKQKKRTGGEKSWEDILRDLSGAPPRPPSAPAPPPVPRQQPTAAPPRRVEQRPRPAASRPMPPSRPAPRPMPVPQAQPSVRRPKRHPAPVQTPPPPPKAPVTATPPLLASPHPGDVMATEIGSGEARAKALLASPMAVAIAKWMTPAKLRHQYMLTEILQPPLALRE